METVEKAKEILQELKAFFIKYEVYGWVMRTDEALDAISKDNPKLRKILYNYLGAGMGSLLDLSISKPNGHNVEDEELANKELERLSANIFEIYNSLR